METSHSSAQREGLKRTRDGEDKEKKNREKKKKKKKNTASRTEIQNACAWFLEEIESQEMDAEVGAKMKTNNVTTPKKRRKAKEANQETKTNEESKTGEETKTKKKKKTTIKNAASKEMGGREKETTETANEDDKDAKEEAKKEAKKMYTLQIIQLQGPPAERTLKYIEDLESDDACWLTVEGMQSFLNSDFKAPPFRQAELSPDPDAGAGVGAGDHDRPVAVHFFRGTKRNAQFLQSAQVFLRAVGRNSKYPKRGQQRSQKDKAESSLYPDYPALPHWWSVQLFFGNAKRKNEVMPAKVAWKKELTTKEFDACDLADAFKVQFAMCKTVMNTYTTFHDAMLQIMAILSQAASGLDSIVASSEPFDSESFKMLCGEVLKSATDAMENKGQVGNVVGSFFKGIAEKSIARPTKLQAQDLQEALQLVERNLGILKDWLDQEPLKIKASTTIREDVASDAPFSVEQGGGGGGGGGDGEENHDNGDGDEGSAEKAAQDLHHEQAMCAAKKESLNQTPLEDYARKMRNATKVLKAARDDADWVSYDWKRSGDDEVDQAQSGLREGMNQLVHTQEMEEETARNNLVRGPVCAAPVPPDIAEQQSGILQAIAAAQQHGDGRSARSAFTSVVRRNVGGQATPLPVLPAGTLPVLPAGTLPVLPAGASGDAARPHESSRNSADADSILEDSDDSMEDAWNES